MVNLRAERAAVTVASQCTGKVWFTSWAKASRAARRQAATHGGKFQPYCCPHCHHFHVGQTSGEASRFGTDPRQRYIVFGIGPERREVLIGYSNDTDGGQVARRLVQTPGWVVSRIVDRKPFLKPASSSIKESHDQVHQARR